MKLPDLVTHVDSLLGAKEDKKLKSLLARHGAQEIAQVLNRLTNGRRKTFALLPPEVQAEVVPQLTDRSKRFILPRISDHTIARFLHFNEDDDAADIMQFLPDARRGGILGALKPEKRIKLEKLLTFDPETAGGLMDLNFLTVKPDMTLREVAERVREHTKHHRHTPMVVVLDERGKALGFVPYKTLMLGHPEKPVRLLLHPLPTLAHHIDQERVLKIATREKGDVFGVVDDRDTFIGVIHLRDLLKIAQMEATEDVLRFAGVSPEEELLGPAPVAIRMRYKWLIINLATAFLASFVVSLFVDTIERVAILAAYMPIVAGMGGNAGTQTLAVAVRGLALGDVTSQQKMQIIYKEMLTGLANGVIVGVIVSAAVYIVSGRPEIGLILGASMVINLVIAGLFGALIPLSLKAMKIDPAVASSVFVTTATDVFGFLTFLGLATVFL